MSFVREKTEETEEKNKSGREIRQRTRKKPDGMSTYRDG
jgi:hypothetical protein